MLGMVTTEQEFASGGWRGLGLNLTALFNPIFSQSRFFNTLTPKADFDADNYMGLGLLLPLLWVRAASVLPLLSVRVSLVLPLLSVRAVAEIPLLPVRAVAEIPLLPVRAVAEAPFFPIPTVSGLPFLSVSRWKARFPLR